MGYWDDGEYIADEWGFCDDCDNKYDCDVARENGECKLQNAMESLVE